jgi:hypothetical protein
MPKRIDVRAFGNALVQGSNRVIKCAPVCLRDADFKTGAEAATLRELVLSV